MYQRQFSTWGISKNLKKNDMLFIQRKAAQREAMDKQSSFTVGHRVVS